jgi:CLIP-associating protein 1/2
VKKGVRKTIVDGVLSKLVSGSGANGTRAIDAQSEGSENGDAVNGSKQKGYVPPSLALQSQKSTATAAGPSGISRTTSTNISRPASRAAMTEPPTPATEGADIQPVYVSTDID